MRLDRLASATVQDVLENPGYYGMPDPMTSSEVRLFVERFRKRGDSKFATVDRGSSLLSAYVRTQKYFVQGPDGVKYACGKSLEKVESVAAQMGLKMEELEIIPQVIPDAGLKCDMEVTFRPKSKIILPGKAF